MTELEMQRAKQIYDEQTRAKLPKRIATWWKSLWTDRSDLRRQRLDRKADIERAAKERL